ncbi:unnamed protein product [Staurois parvus]|uniref:Uncharacterized protein n=1 Tax=Staurois parvus TaxID=386267 RepID=A0ABN9ENW3_9NEOB|nr:unnamed protein product [Staurois parvus]
MGPRTASSCCCQGPSLFMGPLYGPPIAAVSIANTLPHVTTFSGSPHTAARPVICPPPWAPVPPPNAAAQVQSVSWVPVWPPYCCCLHRHTLPCATFRSPHTAGGFHFCHRSAVWPPIAAALPPPHCGAPHSGFGPVTAQDD